jgi:GR25 family glycosyltransferase involved in LPS biosynthesis
MSARYGEYSQYEYLRLASTFKADRIAMGQIIDREIDELLGNPRGMQGYLLRPSHARRLVQRIRRIDRPIDDEIDRCWIYGAPNLVVRPPAVTDRHEPSEIVGETDIRKIQTPSAMFLVGKILEKIQRDLYIFRRVVAHRMGRRGVTGRA